MTKNHLKLIIIRSNPFEKLIKELKMISVSGVLSAQHDALKIFLNWVLFDGNNDNIEKINELGFRIDITYDGNTYELKTKRNVSKENISEYIDEFFPDIVKNRNSKHIWWLVYFTKRIDPKAIKGRFCMYYLNVIEIYVRNYLNIQAARKEITKEMLDMVEKIESHVYVEDYIDDPRILIPVKENTLLLLDRLRREVASLYKKNAENNKVIEPLKQQISGFREEVFIYEENIKVLSAIA